MHPLQTVTNYTIMRGILCKLYQIFDIMFRLGLTVNTIER